MELWRTREDLQAFKRQPKQGPLVLVPTMGALHEGHLDLVRLGAQMGQVVVTVFVNPTQFGPNEDFKSYPRPLERDLELLSQLPVAGVFAPETKEIYGTNLEVTVQPGHRGQGLCGGDRPGHFSGVLTVVAKLFGLVGPDVAIFGRKDAQQCLVIGQMVEDLKMPIQLVDAPTRREADGLAMSSRNRYLYEDQRQQALCLFQALSTGKQLLTDGCRSSAEIQKAMASILGQADRLEYAEVREVPDLGTSENISGRTLLAVSAKVGSARLIDNFVLQVENQKVTESYLLGTGRKS